MQYAKKRWDLHGDKKDLPYDKEAAALSTPAFHPTTQLTV